MQSAIRKVAARLLAATGLLGVVISASAQTFPNRPITFVFPYPAGSGLDTTMRTVSQEVARRLGQPVVVGSRPGAGGRVGLEAAMRSPNSGG